MEKALSLRALGERSGVAFDAINKLENGKRPARLATIRKLAESLGVEPKELMKGEEQGSGEEARQRRGQHNSP